MIQAITLPQPTVGRPILLVLWIVTIGCSNGVVAENQFHKFTESLIGKSTTEIVAELGDPQILTPNLLRYASETTVENLPPQAPRGNNPTRADTDVAVAPGLPVVSSDFCTLDLHLSPKGTVAEAKANGPGCFNFIHWLKHRPAP